MYLSCAESHHKVSNESVFSLPRAVAHHHSPAIRLCQFAAVWEGHLMRPYVTTSIRKPGQARYNFLFVLGSDYVLWEVGESSDLGLGWSEDGKKKNTIQEGG